MKQLYFIINKNSNHINIINEGGGASEWVFYLTAYKLNAIIINREPIDNYIYYSDNNIVNSINDSIIVVQRHFGIIINMHKINPNNKYILWCHDYLEDNFYHLLGNNNYNDVNNYFRDNKIIIVCVSNFHKKNILSRLPDVDVRIIYNALFPEYFPRNPEINYNNDQILFASNWGKGLDYVLKIGQEYYKKNNNFRLLLLKPSYCSNFLDYNKYPFINIIGTITNKKEYCELIQKSLCVITTSYPETFGCVFAEALHLGVPVLGDNQMFAGFHEFVQPDHMVNFNHMNEVIGLIERFRNNRPEVRLKENFYEEAILNNWHNLFSLV
jgi:hypothetical protein